jgi:hypothetical protein
VSRLTIFAKGNVDVRDSLHSLRIGGALLWNGVNEILRVEHRSSLARVRHETWTRSDALLEADGTIPAVLTERSLPLGAYPLAIQFSRAVFDSGAGVVIFSIQPDLNSTILRHRREGFLFYPSGWRSWTQADQGWLREEFTPLPPLDVQASMSNLAKIIERIRGHSNGSILIYNVSSAVPGERVHAYNGLDETLSTRIRRFNLALIELSRQTGISIIDIDTIAARAGTDRTKYDMLHLTADGCRAVAEEVVRVMEDLGCLTEGSGL